MTLTSPVRAVVTAGQLADLIKVGAEGYVHGWVCVKPPCGPHGGTVAHIELGRGTITGVDDNGHLTAQFAKKTAVLGDEALSADGKYNSRALRSIDQRDILPMRSYHNMMARDARESHDAAAVAFHTNADQSIRREATWRITALQPNRTYVTPPVSSPVQQERPAPATPRTHTPATLVPLPAVPDEKTQLGSVNASDLRFTDGKIKHAPSGLVIATAAHERLGPGSVKHTVSHADGTQVYAGTSKKDALAAIAAHHNTRDIPAYAPVARAASSTPAPRKPVAPVHVPAVTGASKPAGNSYQPTLHDIMRARQITSNAGLTAEQHVRLAGEVARHIHLVPEGTRLSVLTVGSLDDTGQVFGRTETMWSPSDTMKRKPIRIVVKIKRDLVTTPSDKVYQKSVRQGWTAPSNIDDPYAGLKHVVAHELGHVIVDTSGRKLGLEALAGAPVSKYGATAPGENLAEAYAMHAHGVSTRTGEGVERAGRSTSGY